MKQSLVAERYAKTLYIAADRVGETDLVQGEFQIVLDLFKKHQEFQQFLVNPTIKLGIKEALLQDVFKKSLSKLSLNFLSLLGKKNRLYLLEKVSSSFLELVQAQRGIKLAIVYSSVALNDEQIKKLKKYFEKVRGGKFNFQNRIDQTLIGGFKIKIKDTVIDWSVKNKLESFKKELLG